MKVQPWKLINYNVFFRIKSLCSVLSSSNISDAYTLMSNWLLKWAIYLLLVPIIIF